MSAIAHILTLLLAALPAERDAERMALESARYLFDIEGDAAEAHRILDRLENSGSAEVRTQAQYLRGRFRDAEGDSADAIRAYARALEGEGLSFAEKRGLVARLLALSPDAIRPMRPAGRAHALPTRVFSHSLNGDTRYVLEEDPENQDLPARLYQQDSEGMLHALEAHLNPGEDILDATPELLLTCARNAQRIVLRRAPAFAPITVSEKFAADAGLLFSGTGETEDFLLLGPQTLRLMRRDRTLYTHPLPGPGCSYLPAFPRSRQGILFCPSGLIRADLGRRAFSPIPLGRETPSEAVFSGEFLALRAPDHVEIRRGPAFDASLWNLPAETQEQISLGREHIFLTGGQGLRAFSLLTGQLDWQRQDGISEVHPFVGELFALTHDRACLAMDEKGRNLFNYQMGWGSESLLLPNRKWLVVQQSDGRRVRLNRELLRWTGGDRGYLFHDFRASLARRDAPGALRALDTLLELEPGNGAAWKEKTQLLRSLGAPRKELAEAWLQLSRSQTVAPWSEDPALRGLAHALGASWIWKQQAGPRFFPTVVAGPGLSFYVEDDNQTLVLIDNRSGLLINSFHFPEPLDLKAACWLGDTVAVSSPARLYFLTPLMAPGVPTSIPLRGPICQAMPVPGGLVYSDWNGSLRFLDPASRLLRWERKFGRSGLLLAHARNSEQLDVFEIEGGYHSVLLPTGRSLTQSSLPPGTITECHAGREFAFAGYNEGVLLAVDRARGIIAWQKDLGEQIFSMAGRGDQTLLIGTASKRVLVVQGSSGAVASQAQLSTYLFNRPLLVDDGYWIGTTAPALEKRSLSTHALMQKLPLSDMPGTPSLAGDGIAVTTLDHFILYFPNR